MNENVRDTSDIDALKLDLAALRADMGHLLEHFRQTAESRGASVNADLGRRLGDFNSEALSDAQEAVSSLTNWVSKRPVLASLIAVGVGYVGARALLR